MQALGLHSRLLGWTGFPLHPVGATWQLPAVRRLTCKERSTGDVSPFFSFLALCQLCHLCFGAQHSKALDLEPSLHADISIRGCRLVHNLVIITRMVRTCLKKTCFPADVQKSGVNMREGNQPGQHLQFQPHHCCNVSTTVHKYNQPAGTFPLLL